MHIVCDLLIHPVVVRQQLSLRVLHLPLGPLLASLTLGSDLRVHICDEKSMTAAGYLCHQSQKQQEDATVSQQVAFKPLCNLDFIAYI